VQNREVAGTVASRLAVAFAIGEIDVEHVDLVVARDNFPTRVDEKRAVGRLVGGRLHGERANVQIDLELARELAEGRKARVAFLRHDGGEELVAARHHDVGHLGRLHVARAALFGLTDQLDGDFEVGRRHLAGPRLDEACAKCRALCRFRGHEAAFPLSRGSSPPALSSA
jgi:hypothetical protein